MGALRRFLEKPAGERRLLLSAWSWLALIQLSLHLLRLARTRRWLARVGGSPERGASREDAMRIEDAVTSAARRVPGARCLSQALVAQLLLARRGKRSTLRLGVRRSEDGAFGAHAWLEQEGQVVFGDPRPEEFTPLSDFEGRAS